MIDFAPGYNPFEESNRDVVLKIEGNTDLEQHMKGLLRSYGRVLDLTRRRSYKRFMQRGLQIAPRFAKRDMPLGVILIEADTIEESLIEVNAEFPSTREYPYIRYEVCSMGYSYPQDFTCPYSFLTNLIRTERLENLHERNFAWNIANHLNNRGYLSGQKIMEPQDVDFAKEVVRDICGKLD